MTATPRLRRARLDGVTPQLRRAGGARRARSEDRGRRVHRPARAVGLRQVDGAELHRRPDRRSTSGTISLDGERIDGLPPERRGFGVVFQSYALFPHMTVRANVAFGLRMRRVAKQEAAARVEQALALVSSSAHADKYPSQLSGGQQQRVAIARAVVIEPPLVLMDEPLSNLDAKLRLEMRTEIRRLHRELGLTTIYVTHDQEEAFSLADRLVRAARRRGRADRRRPRRSTTAPANPYVADFVGFRNAARDDARAARRTAQVVVGGQGLRAARHAIAAQRLAGGRVMLRDPPRRPRRRRRRARTRSRSRVDAVEFRGRSFVVEGDDRAGHARCTCDRRAARARRHRHAARAVPSGCCCSRRGGRRWRPLRRPRHARCAAAGSPSTAIDRTLLLLAAGGGAAASAIFALPVPLRARRCRCSPSATSARCWPTTSSSSPTRSCATRSSSTLGLAVPAALFNVIASVPIAYRMRGAFRGKRLLTAMLVMPVTLGTVLIAKGLLTLLGARGWVNRALLELGLVDEPLRFVHNYWGVLLTLDHHRLSVRVPADAVATCRASTRCSSAPRRRSAPGRGSASGGSRSRCWRPGSRSRSC